MKWLTKVTLALGLLSVTALSLHAETGLVGPGAYEAPAPYYNDVYFHVGPLNLNVPWNNVNAVYLYDLAEHQNMLGGEAVVASLWRIQATAGAVTTLDGRGAPYVGGNLWFPNPIPQIALLDQIKPGIFGGWDWNRRGPIYGFKAAIAIF